MTAQFSLGDKDKTPPAHKSDRDSRFAKAAIDPAWTNALVTAKFTPCDQGLTFHGCKSAIKEKQGLIKEGNTSELEELLTAQIVALNAIFTQMALRSQRHFTVNLEITERFMRLALKAQNQCAKSIEILGALKNPSPVNFVQQANIGNAVQVNNGTTPAASRGKNIKSTNELLENDHATCLDRRPEETAVRTHQNLEAMAEILRPQNR